MEALTSNPPIAPVEQRASRAPKVVLAVLIGLGVLIVGLLVLAQVLGVTSYRAPGQSMSPTLNRNARIIVWSSGDIERGDIVVFTQADDLPGAGTDLIHRAIGFGGETMSFRDEKVFIDDQLLIESYLPPDTPTFVVPNQSAEILIPEGHVFVMGDNRNRSLDSRSWGTILESTITTNHVWVWRSGDEP